MEIILSLVAFFYLGWGLGLISVILCFVTSFAIPGAPWFFRYPVIVPLAFSAASCLALFEMATTGVESVLGLDAVQWLAINAGTQFLFTWIMVGYSLYHFLKHGNSLDRDA